MGNLELIRSYDARNSKKPEYNFFISEKDSGDKEMFDKLLAMYNYDKLARDDKLTLRAELAIKHYIDLFKSGHWFEEIVELLWDEFDNPKYRKRKSALNAIYLEIKLLRRANKMYIKNPLRDDGLEDYYNSPFVQLDLYNYEENKHYARKLRK